MMAFDYINEAFKKLDLLEEQMFNTSLNGINELSNFMDNDDANEIVRVIDPEADTEEMIQDSYVGKVIINCNVCHSHIFENKEEIKIEEDGAVNIEMQCPYCGEHEGLLKLNLQMIPSKRLLQKMTPCLLSLILKSSKKHLALLHLKKKRT